MAQSELPIPIPKNVSESSTEVLRVWIEGGSLQISSNVNLWNQPEYYGLMLGQLGRHLMQTESTQDKKQQILSAMVKVICERRDLLKKRL